MDNHNGFEYYKNLTEFQICEIIKKTLKKNEVNCENCSSNNWDLTYIKIDDQPIYNYNQLKEDYREKGKFVYTYIWTYKNGQPNIIIDNGEPNLNSWEETHNFNKKCKIYIQNFIKNIPENELVGHNSGVFQMCCTGTDNEIDLEKLRYIGFTKEELIYITDNMK